MVNIERPSGDGVRWARAMTATPAAMRDLSSAYFGVWRLAPADAHPHIDVFALVRQSKGCSYADLRVVLVLLEPELPRVSKTTLIDAADHTRADLAIGRRPGRNRRA